MFPLTASRLRFPDVSIERSVSSDAKFCKILLSAFIETFPPVTLSVSITSLFEPAAARFTLLEAVILPSVSDCCGLWI